MSQPAPASAPVTLGFGPLPVNTGVTQVETPEGMRVVVQFHTPQGINAYFLSGEHARVLAGQLEQAGAGTEAGLIVPGTAIPHEQGVPV